MLKSCSEGQILSRLLEPRKLLRTPKVAQTLPSTIGRGLQRIQRNRPTPRNKVRARLLANDSARRPATLYPKSRPYSRISGPVFGEKEEVADQLSLWKIPHRSLLPCRGASNFHVEGDRGAGARENRGREAGDCDPPVPPTSMYSCHSVFIDHIVFRTANF